jgi:hypothetical protein
VTVEWAAVVALTLLALALRLTGLDQSLFQDELATFRVVADNDLDGVLAKVRGGGDTAGQTELTPPLSYVLFWLAVQFGEPTTWLRVPSLVLGTATVPLVHLLGRRTVGRNAGLLAAGLLALSPFALFYANEARAYATMTFFVVLSTLALLQAVDTRRPRWWVLYAVSALAVIYTHYSGVFVVVAQAAWAFWAHRELIRELLVVHAAMVVGYLPWVPFYFEQRDATSPDLVGLFYPISVELVTRESLKVLPGAPHLPLRELPGKPALAAFLITVGAALAALALDVHRRRRRARRPSKEVLLMAILAAVTPIAILAYSLIDTSLYLPRNLSASLPAILLLVAALLVRLPRQIALVAVALVVLSLAEGTLRFFEIENRKPEYRAAARFIDANASPGDPVVERTITFGTARALTPRAQETSTLRINFERRHLFPTSEGRAWELALRGRTVFVVGPESSGFGLAGPPQELADRVKLVESRTFAGRVPVSVYAYSRRAAAG